MKPCPPAYIFLSKHRSESGVPALTAHFTGNFSLETPLGGRPRELAFTLPSLLKAYLRSLSKRREEAKRFQIVLEATHHGPTSLRHPVLFVELGSSEEDWRDKGTGSLIAEALVEAIEQAVPVKIVALALGGQHYSTKFTKLLLEDEDRALASIIPKHALPYLDRELLMQAVEKSLEPVVEAVLDWKGLGLEKPRVLKLLDEADLKVSRL